jgi:amidase
MGHRVTTNPYNTTLTPGGSSGGEGALLGFRGSCLGIGTDIGGSIRSPAANNGMVLGMLRRNL